MDDDDDDDGDGDERSKPRSLSERVVRSFVRPNALSVIVIFRFNVR